MECTHSQQPHQAPVRQHRELVAQHALHTRCGENRQPLLFYEVFRTAARKSGPVFVQQLLTQGFSVPTNCLGDKIGCLCPVVASILRCL